MIRTMFRWVVRSAVVAGAVAAVARLLRRDQDAPEASAGATDPTPAARATTPPTTPAPSPGTGPAPAAARPTGNEAPTAPDGPGSTPSTATGTSPSASTWVAPDAGTCPDTHPVKAKESSGIFHVPGGLAYDRTTPDRCYRDAATAEADGYRQAKR